MGSNISAEAEHPYQQRHVLCKHVLPAFRVPEIATGWDTEVDHEVWAFVSFSKKGESADGGPGGWVTQLELADTALGLGNNSGYLNIKVLLPLMTSYLTDVDLSNNAAVTGNLELFASSSSALASLCLQVGPTSEGLSLSRRLTPTATATPTPTHNPIHNPQPQPSLTQTPPRP